MGIFGADMVMCEGRNGTLAAVAVNSKVHLKLSSLGKVLNTDFYPGIVICIKVLVSKYNIGAA